MFRAEAADLRRAKFDSSEILTRDHQPVASFATWTVPTYLCDLVDK
jgi:hypothetical protein